MHVSFSVWGEVGGQGHLDLAPWYVKLLCGVALSFSAVKLTAACAGEPSAWNRRSQRWLLTLCSVAALMGAITFYYHLHESDDNPDSGENSTTSVCNGVPGAVVLPA